MADTVETVPAATATSDAAPEQLSTTSTPISSSSPAGNESPSVDQQAAEENSTASDVVVADSPTTPATAAQKKPIVGKSVKSLSLCPT